MSMMRNILKASAKVFVLSALLAAIAQGVYAAAPTIKNFAWIEAENPTAQSVDFQFGTSPSKDGTGDYLVSARQTSPNNGGRSASYSFELSEGGSYDLWYLGMDTSAPSFSTVYWGIDRPTLPTAAAGLTILEQNRSGSVVPVVGFWASPGPNPGDPTSDREMFWQQMALGKEIAAGVHTLDVYYAYRAEGSFFFATDCMVIVPSEWGWTPPMSGTAKHPHLSAAEADAVSLGKYLGALGGVTEDIELPETGQAGGAFTYTASDAPDVLDITGKACPPFVGAADALVTLTFDVSKGAQAVTGKTAAVTLPASSRFRMVGLGLFEADGTTPLTDLTANATVKAAVSAGFAPGLSGTATLIITLSDANGQLCGIRFDRKSAEAASNNGAPLELEAALTLPGGSLSGYTLNAVVWDDWNIASLMEGPVTLTGASH